MAEDITVSKGIRNFHVPECGIDRVRRHIRNGGVAILTGQWIYLAGYYCDLVSRRKELLPPVKAKGIDRRDLNLLYKDIFSRILIDPRGLSEEGPFLGAYCEGYGVSGFVPLAYVIDTAESLRCEYRVPVIGQTLIIHKDVLVPRSKETLELIRAGLEGCKPYIRKSDVAVLDMGCGSGVCSFIAADVFQDYNIRITATDHLREAVVTTAINAKRLTENGWLRENAVLTADCGDLFAPVGETVYDIIIFNAPWVNARARSIAETATNDEEQRTVTRFLRESVAHLNPGGMVLLGFSDNSGEKAINRVESAAGNAVLQIVSSYRDRIKTRRNNRSWEWVIVYQFRYEG